MRWRRSALPFDYSRIWVDRTFKELAEVSQQENAVGPATSGSECLVVSGADPILNLSCTLN